MDTLLTRMIARLTAQRIALDWALDTVADRSGPVLEIGLGKGRTYDHLRRARGTDGVLAFDRWLRVGPDLAPPEDRLFLGDFRDTLPEAARRFGRCAVLAHADFGSPDRTHDAAQAAWLAPALEPLLLPGAVVLADRPLDGPGWRALQLPDTGPWPYHARRVG